MQCDGTILIVDDESDNIDVLRLFLKKRGFNVLSTTSGHGAIELLQEILPDIILMDVMMGGIDGFETTQLIKRNPDTERIPVIFLSAKAEPSEKVKGFQVGGVDYVTKPYSFQELEVRILHALMKKRADDELFQRAAHDALTGVMNRGFLYDRLGHALQESVDTGAPLSCLMLDIDHFKQINDTYGHPAGDVVLRSVAETIKSACRQVDAIGRYGGEEFVVVLTKTTLPVAVSVAERIRSSIASSPVDTDKGSLRVTASLGVAQATDGTTVDDLVSRADQAMYLAKRSGRNRVAFEEGGHVQLAE